LIVSDGLRVNSAGELGPQAGRAPRGRTPSLAQAGGHRKKVSVAAALWLSPHRDRLGLYYHTLADGYFDNWYVTAFLEAMLHDLPGRFVVIWDGGTMHKGEPIPRWRPASATAWSWSDCRRSRRCSTPSRPCGAG